MARAPRDFLFWKQLTLASAASLRNVIQILPLFRFPGVLRIFAGFWEVGICSLDQWVGVPMSELTV